MPRPPLATVGGLCYHVLKRGNGRTPVFHKNDDYEAFLEVLGRACDRLPLAVLAYCLMPNHFHLVLQPHADGDLSRWMQWLLTAHVRAYHRHHQSSGHLWQGRFKAFPIETDAPLLAVLRYALRNPARAGLVERAQDWPWSSLRWWRSRTGPGFLSPWPVEAPPDWVRRVNEPETEAELAAMRRYVCRSAPCGSERWQNRIAARLGLESTLRPRGRPRLDPKK